MKIKINLNRKVSTETLGNIQSYLDSFAVGRYNFIHFDGAVSIFFQEAADARLLVENHGRFIDSSDEIYASI